MKKSKPARKWTWRQILDASDAYRPLPSGKTRWDLYLEGKLDDETDLPAKGSYWPREEYHRYISYSKKWKRIRKLVIQRAKNICEEPDCKEKIKEVHHKHYRLLGYEDEDLNCLEGLCSFHHRLRHQSIDQLLRDELKPQPKPKVEELTTCIGVMVFKEEYTKHTPLEIEVEQFLNTLRELK